MDASGKEVIIDGPAMLAAVLYYNNGVNRRTHVLWTKSPTFPLSGVAVRLLVVGAEWALVQHANGDQRTVRVSEIHATGEVGKDPLDDEFMCFTCGFTVTGDTDTRNEAHRRHDGAHEAGWYRVRDEMYEGDIPAAF